MLGKLFQKNMGKVVTFSQIRYFNLKKECFRSY